MELFRTAVNAEGHTILMGIGRDLVWLVIAGSVALAVVHLIWARRRRRAESGDGNPGGPDLALASAPAGIPPRILRHTATARGFHWAMALTTLVLLVTGFAPTLELPVSWSTAHWGAGLTLFFIVAWHVIHAVGWQNFWSMWIGHQDVRDGMIALRHALSSGARPAGPSGKYAWTHKLHHNFVAAAAAVAMATGSVMMVRIDTPLWAGRPSLLGPATWGWVYLAHGLSGVALIGLVGGHVYSALRPERRWMTWSMMRGWITRERYLANHDPKRWSPLAASEPPPPPGGALSDAGLRAPRGDV